MNNVGVSRYEKIKIFLSWCNLHSEETLKKYVDQYSKNVMQRVIDSKWFIDAKNYIINNYNEKIFYLITSTPKKEIDKILYEINFFKYFYEVLGWPSNKNEAIKLIIKTNSYEKQKCIMIGDSITDYNASKFNNINFLLHLTKENKDKFKNFNNSYYQ